MNDDRRGRIEKVPVSRLHPNPYTFRDFPLELARVWRLVASMRQTGVWANLQARPHPHIPGAYQLAAGRHRVVAILVLHGEDYEVPVEVLDLDDVTMLKMMAAEGKGEMLGKGVRCVEAAIAHLPKTGAAPSAKAIANLLRGSTFEKDIPAQVRIWKLWQEHSLEPGREERATIEQLHEQAIALRVALEFNATPRQTEEMLRRFSAAPYRRLGARKPAQTIMDEIKDRTRANARKAAVTRAATKAAMARTRASS